MKTLHILNGDATLRPFADVQPAQNSTGWETLVWREMLSEGPVKADASMTEFWQLRRQWIGQSTVHQGADQYEEKVGHEFDKLLGVNEYDEVVLWFEHDLFCQVNFLFLLERLQRMDLEGTRIMQINVDSYRQNPDFKGIGQLAGSDLATLYAGREALSAEDLNRAANLWYAYAGADPLSIQSWLRESMGGLRYAAEAMRAHLQRFPFTGNNLNLIETQLLTLLLEGPMTEQDLVRRFLHLDRTYGLGDLSVIQYVREMQPYLLRQVAGTLEVTAEGAEQATGRRVLPPVERWLGGFHQTPASPYRWDTERDELIHL